MRACFQVHHAERCVWHSGLLSARAQYWSPFTQIIMALESSLLVISSIGDVAALKQGFEGAQHCILARILVLAHLTYLSFAPLLFSQAHRVHNTSHEDHSARRLSTTASYGSRHFSHLNAYSLDLSRRGKVLQDFVVVLIWTHFTQRGQELGYLGMCPPRYWPIMSA